MGDDTADPTADDQAALPVGTRVSAGVLTALMILSTVVVGAVPVGIQSFVTVLAAGIALMLVLVRSKLGVRIAFLICLLAGAVTGADLLLRVVVGPRLHARPDYAYAERHPVVPARRLCPGVEVTMPVFGDLAAITGEPAHREIREVELTVDEFGYRNSPDAAAGPCGLVLLGDSFGLGSGVTQDRTWASLLAARSGRRVYNLSPPSGGPWHEYATLEAELPRLETEPGAVLVWSIFTGNDLGDEYRPEFGAGAFPEPGTWSRLRTWHHNVGLRSPLRHLLRLVRGGGAARETVGVGRSEDGTPTLFLQRYVTAGSHDLEDVRNHPNAGALAATFDAVARLTVERGMRVLVVSIPTKGEILRDLVPPDFDTIPPGRSGISRYVEQLAHDRQWSFVDLRPALERASASARLWWPDDTHWDDSGHAAAAAEVLRALPSPEEEPPEKHPR